MLYDNYQNKILSIAKKLKIVVKLLPLIIAVVACIMAATVTLLATKGMVLETTCPAEIVYGDSLVCTSKAFLGDVSFEYRAEGSELWSTEKPIRAGNYYVRAVSKGSFGGARYGDELAFKILPKEVDVNVVQDSIVYGDSVSATATLSYGDRLVCESFTFENMLLESTNVTADKATIKINDRNGNDVTDSYIINTPSKLVAITPRTLEVTIDSAKSEYNGQKFFYIIYFRVAYSVGIFI